MLKRNQGPSFCRMNQKSADGERLAHDRWTVVIDKEE